MTTCDKCKGCGKLDSKDNLPWTRYASEVNPHQSEFYKSIVAGTVAPIVCPDCKGSGFDSTKQPEQESKP